MPGRKHEGTSQRDAMVVFLGTDAVVICAIPHTEAAYDHLLLTPTGLYNQP